MNTRGKLTKIKRNPKPLTPNPPNTVMWNLLGQFWVLQSWLEVVDPTQAAPPYWGVGLEQLRERVWVPPPQVTVQAPYDPQEVQAPSTENVNSMSNERICHCWLFVSRAFTVIQNLKMSMYLNIPFFTPFYFNMESLDLFTWDLYFWHQIFHRSLCIKNPHRSKKNYRNSFIGKMCATPEKCPFRSCPSHCYYYFESGWNPMNYAYSDSFGCYKFEY